MKIFVIFAIVFVSELAASSEKQWEEFKLSHGKEYRNVMEEKLRFSIFNENVRQIQKHNERFSIGEETYWKGINQFTDMTTAEVAAILSPMPPTPEGKIFNVFNSTGVLGDETINWVNKGVVTPVKDQGRCGGCWAFSAVGAIEGQVAKAGKGLVSLSPQNLIDCSRNGNMGCNGGRMDYAFTYAKIVGILPDTEYPFVGRQCACQMRGGQKISGYVKVDPDENDMLKALTSIGPISVAIDAENLFSYAGGIYQGICRSHLNHAVLVVGAGSEEGLDYWLIKNSWGASWGENGYFRLPRGIHACGIQADVSYPIL